MKSMWHISRREMKYSDMNLEQFKENYPQYESEAWDTQEMARVLRIYNREPFNSSNFKNLDTRRFELLRTEDFYFLSSEDFMYLDVRYFDQIDSEDFVYLNCFDFHYIRSYGWDHIRSSDFQILDNSIFQQLDSSDFDDIKSSDFDYLDTLHFNVIDTSDFSYINTYDFESISLEDFGFDRMGRNRFNIRDFEDINAKHIVDLEDDEDISLDDIREFNKLQEDYRKDRIASKFDYLNINYKDSIAIYWSGDYETGHTNIIDSDNNIIEIYGNNGYYSIGHEVCLGFLENQVELYSEKPFYEICDDVLDTSNYELISNEKENILKITTKKGELLTIRTYTNGFYEHGIYTNFIEENKGSNNYE